MKNKILFLCIVVMAIVIIACNKKRGDEMEMISQTVIEKTIDVIKDSLKDFSAERLEKGVHQVALLWREEDGSEQAFSDFCKKHFVIEQEREALYSVLARHFEVIWGNSNKMSVELKEPVHMEAGEIHPVDYLFAGYSPGAHFQEDMYKSKIAFITALNFPAYTLQEKQQYGDQWSTLEWAYARMGDVFTDRIPSELQQKQAEAYSNADSYISSYYIWMDKVLTDGGKQLFKDSLRLISHWNLRDQLKADYAEENGLEKQQLIYAVMKHIINQTIPEAVIDNPDVEWKPFSNSLLKDGKEIDFTSEPNTRYEHLLNNFRAKQAIDPYTPDYPNFIARRFEAGMEIPKEEIKQLFIDFISSPQVKKVAALIKKRLGRDLQPFDIWYNGFKTGRSQQEEIYDRLISKKYPDVEAFEKDIPHILINLGFDAEQAAWLGSMIRVDASRGAGHAWGAAMKSDKARLRTNIPVDGMKYKGFNIAMHELGHNVEQTISLHDVEHYIMNGVPNTAFTEALAFIFQKRDMQMLGLDAQDSLKDHLMALDIFWSCYEIMGVSLVDIAVWEWLYENPDATPAQLNEAVSKIAKEVWNSYYADIFGMQDEPILAIYSHMIDNPLYLSAYPIGFVIDFQLEQYLADKDFAEEVTRIFSLGRYTPQVWMQKAIGEKLSVAPLLAATENAVKVMNE